MAKGFRMPKSICTCGHSGDGNNSFHADDHGPEIAPGHGACIRAGCDCKQFRWAVFTTIYARTLRGGALRQ